MWSQPTRLVSPLPRSRKARKWTIQGIIWLQAFRSVSAKCIWKIPVDVN